MSNQSRRERLTILTAAHGITHVRGAVLPLVYPILMRSIGMNYVTLGLMLTITRLAGGLLQGIWGPLAKIVPAKYLIVAEQFGVGVGTAVTGLTYNYGELTGAVTLGQVAASPHHPLASGMISRWYPKSERAGALGLHFAGANLATVLSPLIATFLIVQFGWRFTLEIFALPAFAVGIWVALRLPHEDQVALSKKKGGEPVRFARGFFQPLKIPMVRRLIATASVTAGGKGLSILQTFVPLFLAKGLHLSTVSTGMIFTAFAATSVVGPLLIARLSDRYDRPIFLSGLLVFNGVCALVLGLTTHASLFVLVPLLIVFGLVVYAYSPVEQSLLADVTTNEIRDHAYSLFYGISFGLSALWPVVLGAVLSQFGYTGLFLAIAVSYFVGAGIYGLTKWPEPPDANPQQA